MENQNNQKLKIIGIALILITLIILTNLIKNARNVDKVWNYSEITSALDVISEGTIVNDRKTYYILEDIVVRFLLANDEISVDDLDTNKVGYDASYKDYYSILTQNYKNYLSKSEYEEIAERFINKFTTISAEGYKYINTTNILSNIYLYDDNRYLCVLNSNDGIAYFGVQLNSNNNSYNIFYIE